MQQQKSSISNAGQGSGQQQSSQPVEGTKSIFFRDSAILRFADPVEIENNDANYMSNFEKDKESKTKKRGNCERENYTHKLV